MNTLLLALAPLLAGDLKLQVLHEPFPAKASRFVLGDLDGDGSVDAYGSDNSGDVVVVGEPGGSFAVLPSALPTSPTGSRSATLVDVDSDGDLDVVAAHALFTNLQDRLYRNDGAASFSDATAQLPLDPSATAFVEAGDVDGDGAVDLWVAKSAAADALLLNDGAGTFSSAPGLGNGVGTAAASLADIDADGDLDAFWSGPGAVWGCNYEFRLLANDGSGAFVDMSPNLDLGSAGTRFASFADVEGDGDFDLWLTTEPCPTMEVSFWENDGAGVFAEVASSVMEAPPQVSDYELLDVDGDGDLDMALGTLWTYDYNLVPPQVVTVGGTRLWANDGTGGLSEVAQAFAETLESSGHLASADLDGDGDVDLLRQGALFLGDGLGSFIEADTTIHDGGAGNRPIGDVDGDGWLDVFASDTTLWKGNGTAFFEAVPFAFPGNQFGTDGGVFGDVDGDGDEDLLVINQVDADDPALFGLGPILQDNNLWLNDGSGSFSDVTQWQLPQFVGDDRGLNGAAFLVDVDGDDDLDLLQAVRHDFDGGGGGLELWTNDGTGTFTVESIGTFNELDALAIGDVDADGDVDAFVGEWPFGVHLMLNDGSGAFTAAPAQIPSTPLGSTLALEMGDLDSDGDLDALVSRKQYNQAFDDVFGVWLNDGGGVFSDAGHPLVEPAPYRLLDMDSDGDLDLTSYDSWYANDGSGGFSLGAGTPPVEFGSQVADLDLDGDLDVLNAGTIAFGLEQHLAWRNLPAIGKPLTMDLYGPASGSFVLLASSVRFPFPFPTVLGGISIDPNYMLSVTGGSLDASGHGSNLFQVAASPAAVGLTVWWQGVVGLPPRTTNLEPTTLAVH